MSDTINQENISLDKIKASAIQNFKDLKALSGTVQTALDESQSGLTEIQNIAERLEALGPKGAKFAQDLRSQLEVACAVLDLNETPEQILSIAENIKLAYGDVVLLVKSKESAFADAEAIHAEVQKSAAKFELHLPRPESDLFPYDEGSSDTFNVVNDPDSVISRLRIVKSTDGTALGIAVISVLKNDGPVVNYFYYTNYLELSEGILGREIQVATNDGVLVYRQTLMAAIALADALVTQFGALDTAILQVNSQRNEEPETPSDILESTHDVLPVVKLDEDADADGDLEVEIPGASGDLGGDEGEGDLTDDSADELATSSLESTSSVDDIAEAFDKIS